MRVKVFPTHMKFRKKDNNTKETGQLCQHQCFGRLEWDAPIRHWSPTISLTKT